MEFDIYYNTEFSPWSKDSSSVRIIFDLGEKGLFGTTCQISSNQVISVTKPYVSDFSERYAKYISGHKVNPFVSKNSILGITFPSRTTPERYKELLVASAMQMSHALSLFQKKTNALSDEELRDVYNAIGIMREDLLHFQHGETDRIIEGTASPAPSSPVPPSPASEEWERMDIGSMTAEEVQQLTSLIVGAGNPESGFERDGRRYRISMGSDGIPSIEVAVGKAVAPAVTASPAERRKTVPMVMFKDFSRVTYGNFSKDGFYEFVKSENIGGTQYITILDAMGQSYRLRADNLEVVDVFSEPPKAMA